MTSDTTTALHAPDQGPQDPVQYDAWFKAKVQQAIDDPRPSIPHAQVMAEMRARIATKAARCRQ